VIILYFCLMLSSCMTGKGMTYARRYEVTFFSIENLLFTEDGCFVVCDAMQSSTLKMEIIHSLEHW
jgi:hypothetical protein